MSVRLGLKGDRFSVRRISVDSNKEAHFKEHLNSPEYQYLIPIVSLDGEAVVEAHLRARLKASADELDVEKYGFLSRCLAELPTVVWGLSKNEISVIIKAKR